MRFQIVIIVKGVIHASLLPGEIGQNHIKPPNVAISGRQGTLWGTNVSPAAEGGYKRREMTVIFA